MKIDIYAHILPPKARAALDRCGGAIQLTGKLTSLWDMEQRLRIMDRFEDLSQVLVGGGTPKSATPAQEAEVAAIANEEVAEIVARNPTRFPAGVATLPYKDPELMLREAERALKDLKLKGVLMPAPAYGKPIDQAEFLPLYELLARHDLPVWLHPARTPVPEYKGEDKSRYGMWLLWGYPYESTLAMTRLVFSGVMQKYPNLKMVIHHAGAMVPFFQERIVSFFNSWEMTGKENYKAGLNKEPLDYFKLFYVDTAVNGNSKALALACDFYGAGRVLFGSDFPYDAENGYLATKHAIDAVEAMKISKVDKQKIFETNARKLLNLPAA